MEEDVAVLKEQYTNEVQGLQNTIQDQAEHFTKEIEHKNQIIKDQKEKLNEKAVALIQMEQQRDQTILGKQLEIEQLKEQLDQERIRRMTLEKNVEEQQQSSRVNDSPRHQMHYPTPAPTNSARSGINRGLTFSLRWGDGWSMPCSMERSCNAVVKDTLVYFLVAGTSRVHNFSITDNTSFSLPDCPLCFSSLVIINGILTAVGGSQIGSDGIRNFSNRLFSFTDANAWVEEFPQMPTKRDSTASLHTRAALIVAGGRSKGAGTLSVVEVLNTETLQWSSAPSLPLPLKNASAAICGGDLYLLGGVDKDFFGSKTVFTCSVNALVKSCEPKSFGGRLMSALSPSNMWKRIADLPVTKSTCVSLCGHLLAVGGEDLGYSPTKAIHMYDPMRDSWKVVSRMSVARLNCLVAAIPGNRLMVGGRAGVGRNNNVEFASVV